MTENFNNKTDQVEKRISDLKEKKLEIIQSVKNKKNKKVYAKYGAIIKGPSICIISILEDEEKERGVENLLNEIILEKFLNLERDLVVQI